MSAKRKARKDRPARKDDASRSEARPDDARKSDAGKSKARKSGAAGLEAPEVAAVKAEAPGPEAAGPEAARTEAQAHVAPMKLALLVPQLHPEDRAATRLITLAAPLLAKRGHPVCIITGRYPEGFEVPGTELRAWPDAPWKEPMQPAPLARWARAELEAGDFDVSLSFSTLLPANVVLARNACVREWYRQRDAVGAPSVGGMVGKAQHWWRTRRGPRLQLERQTLTDPMLRRVLAPSKFAMSVLEEHYTLRGEGHAVVYDAFAIAQVDDAQRATWRASVRNGLNIPQQHVVFLYVTDAQSLGGVAALLGVAGVLAERHMQPGFTIVLAGRVPFAEVQRVCGSGLREHLRFVTGARDLAPLLAAAEVTVQPDGCEPLSAVALESMLAGVPVVTTQQDGAAELVKQGIGGEVLENAGDPAALAEAMVRVADPDLAQACRAAATELATALSVHRFVSRLETALRGNF